MGCPEHAPKLWLFNEGSHRHRQKWISRYFLTSTCGSLIFQSLQQEVSIAVCVCVTGIWTKGPALARQVLYHLTHTPSPVTVLLIYILNHFNSTFQVLIKSLVYSTNCSHCSSLKGIERRESSVSWEYSMKHILRVFFFFCYFAV
jgi:hypothetical protein